MSSRVSRADLLEFLRHEETTELESVLDCFGYKRDESEQSEPPTKSDEITDEAKDRKSPPEPKKSLASNRPPEVFYRVQGQEASSLLPAPNQSGELDIPEWMESIKDDVPLNVDSARKRFSTEPPPHQPLVSWSRLWPLLRSIMSQQHTRKRPDIAKLVRQVAKGDQPRRIPQQQRQYWSSKVIILMDRPARLDGLNQDYVQLQKELTKQRGDTGLECWFVKDLTTGNMLLGDEQKTWYPPSPETPILILSDLGIYDRSGEATKQWLRFGLKLRQAGCDAFALVPAPIKYLSDEITQCFQCVSWDRYGSLRPVTPTATPSQTVEQRIKKDQQKADELLALASATTDIEQDYLRSLRYQFTLDQPWHIGHELLVWNHESGEQGSNAMVLSTKAQSQYRDKLANLLSQRPELAVSLYQHVREQLAHTFTLDYVDALCFLGSLAGIQGDERLEAAERYLKQFILLIHAEEQHKGLLFNGQLVVNRQGSGFLKEKPYYSSLWAITHQRTGSKAPRPQELDDQAANAFLSEAIAKVRVQLIQYGEWFYLGGTKALADNLGVEGFPFNPYVLAIVDVEQDLVVEEYEGEKNNHHLGDDTLLKWPVTGKRRVLHVGGQRLDVDALVRPTWAGSFSSGASGFDKPVIQPTGEDVYGVYFDWVIDENNTQRFRFIPPQTFLMGSPENEPGRQNNEIQHEVTLTQGYWLADTTITQSFWEAITGDTFSRLKGDKRPVEKVNWDDTQTFIEKLKQQWPLLDVRLPSEAEWECACRAGTTTAFSFGGKDDLSLENVNYSGEWEGFNFDGETKEVKSLAANPSGLFEMHGRVGC